MKEIKPTLVGIEREYKDTLQEQKYIPRTLNWIWMGEPNLFLFFHFKYIAHYNI